MSRAHLEELRKQLDRKHWRIVSETKNLADDSTLNWTIARPNGDSSLVLKFTPGFYGAYGDFRHNSIDESIACEVVGHSEIPHLYFGKFYGQYQKDLLLFLDAINVMIQSPSVEASSQKILDEPSDAPQPRSEAF